MHNDQDVMLLKSLLRQIVKDCGSGDATWSLPTSVTDVLKGHVK